MKRTLFPVVALLLILAGLASAQNSGGGSFLPGFSYVVGGQWTWRAQASPFVFEGTVDDPYETTFTVTNPTADRTFTLPDNSGGTFMFSTLATNGVDVANSVWGASNALVFEGATADANELTLSPADVAADITVTIPDTGAAAALLASLLTTNAPNVANSLWGASNALVFEGATADAFELSLGPADVAADRAVTIPDPGADAAVFVSLLTTNAPQAANSVWAITGSALVFEGATADANEATLTFTDPAADGTLTLTLAGQAAGEQLQTDGSGVLTWEAAGSKREYKTLEGRIDPAEALQAILSAPVYRFHYRPVGANGERTTTTGDFRTQYVGIMADEAPWAMHHNGNILNPVNTAGYTFAAIQALEQRLAALEAGR